MFLESKDIEAYWPLTGVRLGPILKKTDGNRSVSIIDSNEGKYICKIADEWKTSEYLKKDLLAYELLPARNFHHISKLLKTNNNQPYVEVTGKNVYLLEYVEGENPIPSRITYTKLGGIIAELHSVMDYPYPTQFQPLAIIQNDLPSLVRDQPFQAEYMDIVRSLPDFNALPTTLIHTDVAPVNAIEKSDGEIILIDWDDVGVGVRILDIAFPLIQQFTSEDCEFNTGIAKAFYNAYKAKIQLTDKELDRIFDAALFIALMYIIYGNIEKRWNRIQWSLKNRSTLEQVFK